MSKTLVIASGKGGTGKSMFTTNIGATLAKRGHNVCLLDLDTGLRNLDLYLGLENVVVYDIYDVLKGVCRIKQALIKDKIYPNLYFMAASPNPDTGEITPAHIKILCEKLSQTFEYIIIDAPAGVDDGFQLAISGADKVIMVLVPEYASIRDSEVVTKTLQNQGFTDIYYVLNKINTKLINQGLSPKLEEIPNRIKDRIIGAIQEDENIHISTNMGYPIVNKDGIYIEKNFQRIAERIENL